MIQLTGHRLTLADVWKIARCWDSCELTNSARANALARVFSGVRPGVVGSLITMLNDCLLPEFPSVGFVGTIGDLV